jgi:serine/threonine-protein kinase HipA
MTAELVALLAGRIAGRVTQDSRGRLAFTYDDGWRNAQGSWPLSLSMPLAVAKHEHKIIEAFLWGLLPDNEIVLGRWGLRFQVSARNAFALMNHVGEDCAGAVQFVRPERLEAVQGEGPGEIYWLDESSVARRLRLLRTDHAAWRSPGRTEAVLTAHGTNAPMQRTNGLYATGGCTDVIREGIERQATSNAP